MKNNDISIELVATQILVIRGKRVMLDTDLANLYGVATKRLNEQVKRNLKRFPEDFMFSLTTDEKNQVVANCDHLRKLKFSPQLPYAFTQEGIAMLSSALNSERAIQVNIAIMRAFVKLREFLLTHKELAEKINELERKYNEHDSKIIAIFEAIRQLLEPPPKPPKPRIGFH
jgi:hypothetical protein